jgi:tRNA-dihydrouridine synthase B
MKPTLLLAPLQSYTDHHFRNAYQQLFGSVDRFYAPYLKMAHDGTIKPGPKIDVLPEKNPYDPVIPQVMACCAEDLLVMTDYLTGLGYTEINWNMGCPYPMVTTRDLGAGILDKPDKICGIIETVLPKMNARLGIKMRMGNDSTADILELLPRLNDYPISEIIVHARYAKQLYNGGCDLDRFAECIPLTNHPLAYNGDITTVEEFRMLQQRFPTIRNWMIGRGAVCDPFLFEMIEDDTTAYPDDRYEAFGEFIGLLLESHLRSSNEGNALNKMKSYWEYFAEALEDGHRIYRKIKKAKTLKEYNDLVESYLCNTGTGSDLSLQYSSYDQ